ncbi:SDR family oxidoreductase [Arthrobacter sp. MSA 4-2]|uniref:SDR family NAD(P)-dependent oxidoreductase n=1 Tax=Arthrobacter sp. MSA 4-2 TaxID=2794349 RepID=UPI0018E85786|nr:SDR family oxidoreductase [Arthrobacter sp. MSA 4-2]MBJ2121601.1 SDR family oxidoreductase [Arthrobacter sp. MSA 4-2]
MARNYEGTTALITGASSGLGEEFARQLAHRGADLILVARRADRLEALSEELRGATGRTVTVIPADLARAGAGPALAAVVAAKGLSVDSLVNNAGFATRARFEDEDAERIQEEIALNVAALVGLTRAFYPAMLASGKGVLINLASTGAYQPVPLMAVYGATKAFVLSFTEALWVEARRSHLGVLALSPGATRTEFFDVAGEDAQVGSMQAPSEVVTFALRTLDRRWSAPSVVSGKANRLTASAPRFLPRRAVARLAGAVTGRR